MKNLGNPPEKACIGKIGLNAETDDWQEWQKLEKDVKRYNEKIHRLYVALGAADAAMQKILDTSDHPEIIKLREERKKKGLEWLADLDVVVTPTPLGKEKEHGS